MAKKKAQKHNEHDVSNEYDISKEEVEEVLYIDDLRYEKGIMYLNHANFVSACKSKKISVEELGKRVGVSYRTLCNYYDDNKKHTSGLSEELIESIARELDTTDAYLLGYIDYPDNDKEGVENAVRTLQLKLLRYGIKNLRLFFAICDSIGYPIRITKNACKDVPHNFAVEHEGVAHIIQPDLLDTIKDKTCEYIASLFDIFIMSADDTTIIPQSDLIIDEE